MNERVNNNRMFQYGSAPRLLHVKSGDQFRVLMDVQLDIPLPRFESDSFHSLLSHSRESWQSQCCMYSLHIITHRIDILQPLHCNRCSIFYCSIVAIRYPALVLCSNPKIQRPDPQRAGSQLKTHSTWKYVSIRTAMLIADVQYSLLG